MSTRDWLLRIEDILESIQHILDYTEGMDLTNWASDRKTIDAVVRNFEIIGEAANHVPPEIQSRFPDIPWSQMRGIRNILIHEYFGVDEEVIWETVQNDLPSLQVKLNKLR
jgi:uncharacterized protein with HEPN domain